MARRSLSVVFLLAILVGTFWIFQQFKIANDQSIDPIQFIPDNTTTLVCLNTENWNLFYSQSSALSELLGTDYNLLIGFVEQFDSLRSQQDGIQNLLDVKSKYLSFFESHEKSQNWLFTMGLNESQNSEYFKKIFPKQKNSSKKIGEIDINESSTISWIVKDQILWASPNSNLLIETFDKIAANQTLILKPNFKKAIESIGKTNIQIVSRKSNENFQLINNQQSNWRAYDLRLNEGKTNIFGYSFNNNDENFNSKVNNSLSIPWNLFPSKDLSVEMVNIDNIENYLNQIKSKVQRTENISSFTNNISAIESNCQCEVTKIAFNRTKSVGVFENGNKSFSIINYSNFDEAAIEYLPLIKMDSNHEVNGFPIMEIKYSNLYSTLLNQPSFESIKYFTYKDDFLIFTSKIENLHWIIDQWSKGKTESQNNEQSISKKTDWFFHQNNTKNNMFAFPFQVENENIVWQKIEEKNRMYNHIIFDSKYKNPMQFIAENPQNKGQKDENTYNLNSQIKKRLSIVIDAEIISIPSIITNHYTKEKEIFVQDKNNNIYLVNNKAKLLWKKKISEEIKGNIEQIDVYKNGKLQIVFNTENKIFCIDRNGKDVEGFPINLKNKATSKLAIFDYDKKRKYRLVIACSDKEIYNYTIEGKNTIGWKYKAVDSPVKDIQHFKIKGKDYIFTLLQNNKISILKRTGAIKYKSTATAIKYNGNSFALDIASSINDSRMLFIDTEGNLVEMPFDQNTPNIELSGLNKNSSLTFQDLDGDKKEDYIISSGNDLKVYDSNLKLNFSKSFNSSIIDSPLLVKFNSKDNGIGIITSNGKFVTVDVKGVILESYTMNASKALQFDDLDLDGQLDMITVNKNIIEIK